VIVELLVQHGLHSIMPVSMFFGCRTISMVPLRYSSYRIMVEHDMRLTSSSVDFVVGLNLLFLNFKKVTGSTGSALHPTMTKELIKSRTLIW